MMKLRATITLSVFAICCFTSALCQSRYELLTKKLDQQFDKDGLPGLSVVLVDSTGIIYEHNLGYADISQKKRYASNSVQSIGSVSKTFAAVALMKAVELKYFTLDTDINDILPFKVVNPYHPNDHITIRQLATHTSSIADNPDIYPNTYHFETQLRNFDSLAFNQLQQLGYRQAIEDSPLKDFMFNYLAVNGKYYHKENFVAATPGSDSNYSNIGTALIAYLIEVKSKMAYTDFTRKYVFQPLKMRQSNWSLDKHSKLNALPYLNRDAALPFYHCITYPDGGLRTTTTDLAKYLVAIIKGVGGDRTLLSQQSFDAMFHPQFSADNLPSGMSLANRNKGILWNLYNSGAIGHDGDDPGVSTFLFFNAKTKLGGVFLTNKYLADKSGLIKALVEASQ